MFSWGNAPVCFHWEPLFALHFLLIAGMPVRCSAGRHKRIQFSDRLPDASKCADQSHPNQKGHPYEKGPSQDGKRASGSVASDGHGRRLLCSLLC